MQTRKLGKSGLEVSALGLGCMRMSFGDKPVEKQEMLTFLHQEMAAGRDSNRLASKATKISDAQLARNAGNRSVITESPNSKSMTRSIIRNNGGAAS